MQTLTVLMAMTGSNLRRLLREGMVRRALGFPVVLTIGTLVGTLLVVAAARGPAVIAVHHDTPAAERTDLTEAGFEVTEARDPREMVREGLAVAGLDHQTLYVDGGRDALQVEASVRRTRSASWWPEPPPLPGTAHTMKSGATIATLLVAIYALYGVVFGAGLVARDRDDGSLEVELTLPMPAVVHGLSRWFAASAVLCAWVALAVGVSAGLLGLADGPALLRIGTAASIASVALGLASVGRAGLQSGFAGSLAAGLTATTGLLAVGYAAPGVGAWLPLASIVAGGSGWMPLLIALLLGPVAVLLFTWRSARP